MSICKSFLKVTPNVFPELSPTSPLPSNALYLAVPCTHKNQDSMISVKSNDAQNATAPLK